MNITSPIGQLMDVLEKVRDSSIQYRSKLEKNEAATRAVLIDPVLRALGWDITNLNMVEFERTYSDTRVDYALYDKLGNVKIIVEAKALGINIQDAQLAYKLFAYAFKFGIRNVVMTNGITWQLFSSVEPGNVEPLTLDLNKNSLDEVGFSLIQAMDAARYWKIDPITLSEPTPEVKVPPSPPDSGFVALQEIKFPISGATPPKQLKLPDGSVLQIRYWREILSESCKFILNNNQNIEIPYADKAGKKNKLFSWDKPIGSGAFDVIQYRGKTLYVFLNYSAENCVENAKYILKLLPGDKNFGVVEVKF